MSTEAETRAEALAELAAIRQAAPLYVGKAAPAEAEARAEAATTGVETNGAARGAIVLPDTEAEARAARAAAARAELPAIEWHPAPKQQPRELSAAEQAEAEAARKAEQRKQAAIARELLRAELADNRAAEARQARRAAVVGNAESMFTELQGSPAELKAAARKARATTKLAAAEARAAFLSEAGITEAEAREQELLAELADNTVRDGLEPRKAKDAGQDSVLSPAELAAVAEWTQSMLNSPAARAGRQALDAMGPRASAMVVSSRKARKITVATVCRVPNVETAEARAGKAAAAHKAAAARLAEAEAAEAAAKGQQARQPIRKAEAEADRLAAIAGKAAARASKAEQALELARQLAGRPAIEGLVWLPVASFKLAEAEQARELESIRERKDRMPARYADRGPAAKTGVKLTDNTARLAIAEVMKLSEAEVKAMWAGIWADIRQLLADKAAAEAAEAAAARAEYLARRAAAARDRRARQRH